MHTAPSAESLEAISQELISVPYTETSSKGPYRVEEDDTAALEQREAAKLAFEAGDDEWPDLTYPGLYDLPLDVSERGYLKLLTAVTKYAETSGADDILVADVVYEQIARKLAEVYSHKEIMRRLDRSGEAQRAKGDKRRKHLLDLADLSRHRSGIMSSELYGDPEQEAFDAILAADIHRALQALESTDETRKDIAIEFLERLGLTPETAESKMSAIKQERSAELEDDTIDIIRGDVYTIFPSLESDMQPFREQKGSIKPIDALPAFQAALRAMGSRWKVRLLRGKSEQARTSDRNEEITFGELRKAFSPEKLWLTSIHEAGHAVRGGNAKAQKEPHRRIALPGSADFEEGVQVVIEQILSGKKRVPGEKYYLQIGLLKGMYPAGGNKEQSYRTTYEIMWRRAALLQNGELTEDKQTELKDSAYDSVMRTARGNVRDNRDINYFAGAYKATQFMNETAKLPKHVRIARLRWMMSGMFDPTIPEHAAAFGGDPAAPYLEAA